jgi:hypothetical protein
MEVLKNAQIMETLILRLKQESDLSEELIELKAHAMREYDKQMGVFIAKLKDAGVPTTVVKERAKAECAELLYEKVVRDESLKAHYSRLDTLKAQLNGYQSINRYLDSTG